MVQDLIITAEQEWLGRAYAYCRECFRDITLPSHDERHHLRTWYHARELLTAAQPRLSPPGGDGIKALLLACLLHDTGMSETLSPAHGAASRRLAERFFSTLPEAPPLQEEILTAIEKHDDKTYRQKISGDTPAGRIFTLLAVADDLDAFGYTGVCRYYEIYSLRHIPVTAMAGKVQDNLEKRFGNMQPLLSSSPALLQHHRQRYLITRNFFEDLAGRKKEEALTVIRFLEDLLKDPPHEISRELDTAISGTENAYLKKFLSGWRKEMEEHNTPAP